MNLPRQILVVLVRLYQWTLSPLLSAMFGPAGRCRFTPSCSQYAVEALQTHGAAAGTVLAARRLCRCHPWGGCGNDPVPPRKTGAPNTAVENAAPATAAARAMAGGPN